MLDAVPLGVLQFHGRETPEFCRRFGRPYVKALAVRAPMREADLLEWAGFVSRCRRAGFSTRRRARVYGGTGHTFDWSALPKRPARPLVLSGGLDARNVVAGDPHGAAMGR